MLFGRSFWARGYCVTTLGLDESAIRQYIQDQEQHQKNQEQDELNVTFHSAESFHNKLKMLL